MASIQKKNTPAKLDENPMHTDTHIHTVGAHNDACGCVQREHTRTQTQINTYTKRDVNRPLTGRAHYYCNQRLMGQEALKRSTLFYTGIRGNIRSKQASITAGVFEYITRIFECKLS